MRKARSGRRSNLKSEGENIKLTVNIGVKHTTTSPVKFILIKYKKGGGGYSKKNH